MRRSAGIFAFALLLGACAPTAQDRLRAYTRDGVHFYRVGAYAEARETFRAALALRPDDPDLVYDLARCHDKLGQQGQAEELYRRCIVLAPDHAEARHALVARLLDTDRRPEAEALVRDWLRGRPDLAAPYVEDGWLRAGQGDLPAARGRFQQALALEPRNPRALAELAGVYERSGRPDRAAALYERSLEANPDQPAVRQRLGQLVSRGVGPPRPD